MVKGTDCNVLSKTNKNIENKIKNSKQGTWLNVKDCHGFGPAPHL